MFLRTDTGAARVGVFENTLGGLGRWIDSIFRAIHERTQRRSRASSGRTLGERRRDLAIAIQRKLESTRRSWERAPDHERRKWTVIGILVAALLLGLTSGVAAFYFLGGRDVLSGEDAAAVKALRDKMEQEQKQSTPGQLFPGAR
ncbi:MAG: hypothetical protein K2W85_05425 [Phycisphaerales bacterium]|nr:hypothetical protein [Phycisphaerales bacterium]